MAKIPGNKPARNVEAHAYSGRTSPSRKEWMGDCADRDATKPQDPIDQHAKGYSNIVPDSRRFGDQHGVNPNFDVSDARRNNDRPISKDGGNCEKSPFSAANSAAKAESDWNPTYQPRKHKG